MDPFSLTIGIASLLELSGKILGKGYGFLSSVQAAPEHIRLLLMEVAALTVVLGQLQTKATKDQASNTRPEPIDQAFSELVKAGCLTNCRQILLGIQGSMSQYEQNSGQQTPSLRKRMLWPFKEKETRSTLLHLQSLRENFTAVNSIDSV
jgi:hypothetical protein